MPKPNTVTNAGYSLAPAAKLQNVSSFDTITTMPYNNVILTIPTCSHEGATCYDKTSDVYIKIPKGAIPKDVSITIDIATTLYGPYSYPDGLRPVSPVLWICARGQEHFEFLKPVEISLPHYLRLSSEAELVSLGLTVLKSGHEVNESYMHGFYCTTTGLTIDHERTSHCKFNVTHFCYMCLAANDSRECMSKARYCCTQVESLDKKCVYFYISYFLTMCIDAIEQKFPATTLWQTTEFSYVPQENQDGTLMITPEPEATEGWRVRLGRPYQV